MICSRSTGSGSRWKIRCSTINQSHCGAAKRNTRNLFSCDVADALPRPPFPYVTLNVIVTSAALRKHERPWAIGDIVEVLEA
jgi:hypothetical protein